MLMGIIKGEEKNMLRSWVACQRTQKQQTLPIIRKISHKNSNEKNCTETLQKDPKHLFSKKKKKCMLHVLRKESGRRLL